MRPVIFSVVGGTGSGKTTVARNILRRIGQQHIAYVPHDAYYIHQSNLSLEERRRTNYDHPDSLETSLMIEHIHQLVSGKAVDIPVYDFTVHLRTAQKTHVEPAPIILVEGILILAEPELRKLFDVKIFVDTDADLRLIRRLQRDMQERGRTFDSVINQYLTTVRPMHMEFVEPSKRFADVIIPQGGRNEVAIDLVAARIRNMLEQP
ncbi:MAG TPA: uridine kinase [Anaerolineae bacterium]